MSLLTDSNFKLATYLINMAEAHERREAMLSRLAALGISAQRIEGIDGKTLDYPVADFCEISYKLLHGRRRSPPEVGCYLSHIECAREFLKSDAEFALILEDDVVFESDFVEAINAAMGHAKDWDILRLTTVNDGRKYAFKRLTQGRCLAIALTREKGAGAYVINRRAAKWMVTKLLPMRLAFDIAFDLEYLSGLKSAFIHPLCANQFGAKGSQIQSGIRQYRLPRWRYLTVLPYRAYLETTRFVCRATRLAAHRIKKVFWRGQTRLEAALATPSPLENELQPVVSPGVNPTR